MSGSASGTESDFAWAELRDHTETPIGRIGVPTDIVLHDLIYADGFTTAWAIAPVEVGGTLVAGMPVVLLSVPDYPDPERGRTIVISLPDLTRLIETLQAVADEGRKRAATEVRKIDQATARVRSDRDVAQSIEQATRCAVEHCSRDRRFFDAEGNGFCKRHAAERGIRPHGKIV